MDSSRCFERHRTLLDEIHALEQQITAVERQLEAISRQNPLIARLRDIAGTGLLTATVLYASANDARYFRSGRQARLYRLGRRGTVFDPNPAAALA